MFKKKNSQKIIAFALAYLISFPAISYAVTNLVAFLEIPVISSAATPILYISFYISLVLAVLHTMGKTTWARLAVTTFMALSFLFAWTSEQSNSRYMWTSWNDLFNNPAYTFWLFSFSAFLLSGHIRDMKVLCQTMERFSYVSVVLALMHYLAALNNGREPEYMSFSYNILFATAYLFILYMNRPDWRRLAVGLVGAVLILIAGCRGALVGLLVSIAVSMLYDLGRATRHRVVTVVFLAAAALMIMLFWQDILDGLMDLLDTLGIRGRTITKIASASFLEDSGRSRLIAACLDNIGIVGRGLYGDRVILNGSYAHNIVVEILVDYGMLLGTVILAVLGIVIVTGLHRAENQSKMMICALIAVGLVKLSFSGSFLNKEAGLYLLIGLCVNSIRNTASTARRDLE